MSAIKANYSDSNDLDEEGKNTADSKQIVKMVFRKPVATTPISLLIESLVKQLSTMIESNEDKALKLYNFLCEKFFEMKLIDKSYQMTEFEGMRSQYERALYHLVSAARGGEEPVTFHNMWPSENTSSEWSHYQREFDELEYIAGGGFGRVFRVRHKLDGSQYAVKKIIIRANDINSVTKYLDEVKTFASLNHSNIVPYKAAWLELGIPTNKKAIEMIQDNSNSYVSGTESAKLNRFSHITTMESCSSEFSVQFENPASKQYSYSNSNIIVGEKRRGDCSRRSRNSISEGGKAICKFDFEQVKPFKIPEQQWATLYIQMALCQITLKQWLDTRNSAELPVDQNETALIQLRSKIRRDTIIGVLQQLLRGIQYIHLKQIVHHDIKPSNIFLQVDGGSLIVQLGDFGLACPLQSAHHTLAFGTKLYAAPEQLAGKCDSKSDMYSLGIVLLELVETFRTDMERVRCISELRKGHLSSHITAKDPQLAHIISQLVSRYPHMRPDATELLLRLENSTPDESARVRDLESRLAEKENEIEKLRESLKSAREKETELKEKLKSAGVDV